MVVYGGATGGGFIASVDLFLLDMRNGKESAIWMIVPMVGSTPGRRYRHTIIFAKPHLLFFLLQDEILIFLMKPTYTYILFKDKRNKLFWRTRL
jgi:hypothetical protein